MKGRWPLTAGLVSAGLVCLPYRVVWTTRKAARRPYRHLCRIGSL
jgi:hypothetical protein